ncbi:hypothetical protein F5148DRAFT_689554 [Russula earlei]|uniref:Uncharacterized protein n=1 Tax=Russula earlei TaxID=71964 RepID=A0ACC0TVD6_9AGAM|nr:hypothetical protein F5148DRAFT_689554 [Russula earlei]
MAHVRIRPSFRSLPPELIEEIIITSTLLGDTRAAATLARTCRWFRVLVYHQMHKHLWRELFLVVFDDPRPGRTVRTRGGAPWSPQIDLDNKGKVKIKNRLAAHDFPWEHEYKLRIWTESFILRRTRPPPPGSPSPSPSFPPDLPCTDDDIYTVLETLLRVILTAAPLPYDTLACMASHFQTCSPPHPHPIFSPLFVAAHAHQALVMSSRNTTWLAHVLAHGLPRILMVSVKWDGLLAKFVAQVGLMTPFNNSAAEPPHDPELISPLTADADADGCGSVSCGLEKSTSVIEDEGGGDGDCDELETYHSGVQDAGDLSSDDDDSDFVPQPEDGSTSESDEERISDIDGDEVLGTTATPATTPQDGVRRLARVRVYNMAYLRPSRAFGPFLPLNTHDASSSPATSNPGSSTLEREDTTRSPSIVVPPVPAIPDTNFFLRALAGAVDGSDFDGNESLLFFDDDRRAPCAPQPRWASALFLTRIPPRDTRGGSRRACVQGWGWMGLGRCGGTVEAQISPSPTTKIHIFSIRQ